MVTSWPTYRALRRWIRGSLAIQAQMDVYLKLPPDQMAEININRRRQTAGMARRARQHLPYVMRDNSDLDANRLAEIAGALSPGGVHNGADLYWALIDWGVPIDKHLQAALFYYNWSGGKVGFQFMPNPRTTRAGRYREAAEALATMLFAGHGGDLRRLLIGDDLTFYERLPDTFTVYRGADGVSVPMAAAGPCWTLSRDLAEWFAHRSGQEPRRPFVVSTAVSKGAVLLVNYSEAEVVLPPQTSAKRLPLRHAADRPRPPVDLDGVLFS